MKNVHKSALALTFLMASAANAFELPSMPDLNATNAALTAGAVVVGGAAYAYRKNIKNAISSTASAAKKAASVVKNAIVENPVKSAVIATVIVTAIAYRCYNSPVVVVEGTDSNVDANGAKNVPVADKVDEVKELINNVITPLKGAEEAAEAARALQEAAEAAEVARALEEAAKAAEAAKALTAGNVAGDLGK